MKKTMRFLAVLALAVLSVSFTSCQKNNDPTPTPTPTDKTYVVYRGFDLKVSPAIISSVTIVLTENGKETEEVLKPEMDGTTQKFFYEKKTLNHKAGETFNLTVKSVEIMPEHDTISRYDVDGTWALASGTESGGVGPSSYGILANMTGLAPNRIVEYLKKLEGRSKGPLTF